jgi:hypothetical protein
MIESLSRELGLNPEGTKADKKVTKLHQSLWPNNSIH